MNGDVSLGSDVEHEIFIFGFEKVTDALNLGRRPLPLCIPVLPEISFDIAAIGKDLGSARINTVFFWVSYSARDQPESSLEAGQPLRPRYA